MRHLVIGQRQKAPNFSALVATRLSDYHWSAFRNHESSTFTEKDRNKLNYQSDQSRANHQLLQLCTVPTAWSDSDQAVRAVHSCKSWFWCVLSISYFLMFSSKSLLIRSKSSTDSCVDLRSCSSFLLTFSTSARTFFSRSRLSSS